MNRSGFGWATLVLGTCLSWASHAQSTGFGGTVALSSQLVDRGQAITASTPILQGDVTWTSPAGWLLGLSAGTELRAPGQLAEASVQVARYWPLSGDWQMQTDLLYYRYSGSARTRAYDRAETGIHWTYRDVLTLGLSAVRMFGAPDGRVRGAADLDFHWPLPRHFYLSAGAGIAQIPAMPCRAYEHADSWRDLEYGRPYYGCERHGSYRYGHAGLIWAMGGWRMELERIVTAPHMRRQRGAPGAAPWVATVSRSF